MTDFFLICLAITTFASFGLYLSELHSRRWWQGSKRIEYQRAEMYKWQCEKLAGDNAKLQAQLKEQETR